MAVIQLNALRLNAVDANVIALEGVRWRGSHAGTPPIVPPEEPEPDTPVEPDVPSNPEVDENGYIIFEDVEVARICAEKWGDGTGITLEQAAAVTSVGTVFRDNTTVTSFNEFGKFTKAQAIPANAFNGCTSLSSIDLSNVTSLGASALYGCTSLYIEDMAMPKLETLGKNALYDVKIKAISDFGKITTLPTADSSACNYGNRELLECVLLPDSLNAIPGYSFYAYAKIANFKAPDSVTSIDAASFKNCSSLLTFIGIGGVTIGAEAFSGSKKLKAVVFGEGVASFAWRPFRNCSSLAALVLQTAVPPTISELLTEASSSSRVYVPDSSVEAYRSATNWNSYASRIFPISQLPTDNPELYEEIKQYL